MRYGFVFPSGTPTEIVDMAVAAEAAGWDGAFCWEGIYHYDPWVILSAIAMRTEKIRLGTMLTPAPRRRPWKLAAECVSLDQLSGGRVILSVGVGAFGTGLGDPGEETDVRVRAERLDETIDLMRAMWTGKPVQHEGKYYKVDLPGGPKPVQKPSIPIWCVGLWPRMKSMQRVLRCDGAIPYAMKDFGPGTIAEVAAYIRKNRTSRRAYDIIADGTTSATDAKKAADVVRPWADAGATWWIEANWSAKLPTVRKRIDAGPPRID
jgi:hypothetical protein